jgi:acyl carrier protein
MTPTSPPAVDLVSRVLHAVLGDEVALTADTPLFDVAGFDSLALAAVVEGLEAALGTPLPDELITPEAFGTPGDIAGILVAPVLSEGAAP